MYHKAMDCTNFSTIYLIINSPKLDVLLFRIY